MDNLRELIGIKFVNGGRNIRTGLDCWGLVMEIFRRKGITVPDFIIDAFDYKTINNLAEKKQKVWMRVDNPVSTDAPLVVIMRIHPILITHAGVFIGGGKVIHTTAGTGVIISRIAALKNRIVGYYRPC